MATTLLQLFRNQPMADRAVRDLTMSGIDKETIGMINNRPDGGQKPTTQSIQDTLMQAGVPDRDATMIAGRIMSGETLVLVIVEDEDLPEAERILNDAAGEGAAERAHERTAPPTPAAAETRGMGAVGGVTGAAAETRQAQPTGGPKPAQPTAGKGREEIREPVIQEELAVGKREVEAGGVRMTAKTTEQPVEEKVRLREEHVEVERRPTDRPATPSDFGRDRGKEGTTVEVREMREEPVVGKRARVVEEVVVRKETGERTETVRDTVRRRDVEIRPIPVAGRGAGEKGKERRDLSQHEPAFRRNYDESMRDTGLSYEDVTPAYTYGADLAQDRRYAGRQWNEIEPGAQKEWEGTNPGTWDRVKSAVRHGWERMGHGSDTGKGQRR